MATMHGSISLRNYFSLNFFSANVGLVQICIAMRIVIIFIFSRVIFIGKYHVAYS